MAYGLKASSSHPLNSILKYFYFDVLLMFFHSPIFLDHIVCNTNLSQITGLCIITCWCWNPICFTNLFFYLSSSYLPHFKAYLLLYKMEYFDCRSSLLHDFINQSFQYVPDTSLLMSLIFEEKSMCFHTHSWVVPRSSVSKHNKKQTGV